MDPLTPEQRRKNMQANKATGTSIELMLGKALHAEGLRYRKNDKTVAGTPDFTFKKYKVAVFSDGDFWHGKDWETRKKQLGQNAGFWYDKIERNIERDYKVTKQLCEDGWTVLRFWETDIRKKLPQCVAAVVKAMDEAKARLAEEAALRRQYHKHIHLLNRCEEKVISDYLETRNPVVKSQLKDKAVKKTKDLLQYQYPEETVTSKVAEEMLKYLAGKKK